MVDGVEIEGALKHDQDLGCDVEEMDSKSLDAKNKVEGETMLGVVDDAGGLNKIEDGEGQCLHELIKEADNNVSVDDAMEDRPNPQRETSEPMLVEESGSELVNAKSKDEERSNTKTNVEEQTVNGEIDAKSEVVEHNAFDGGVGLEKTTENGVEDGHPVNNVIEEKNAENGMEGETSVENVLAESNAGNGVEEGSPIKNVMEEKNAENFVEEGNPVKSVTVERNAEDIIEGGENPVNNVAEENPGVDFSEKDDDGERSTQNMHLTTDIFSNEAPPNHNAALDKVLLGGDEEMKDTANKVAEVKEVDEKTKEQGKEMPLASHVEIVTKHEGYHLSLPIEQEAAATPSSLVRYMPAKAGDLSGETTKTGFAQDLMSEGDDGTPEDQAAFMNEIESFYRERAMDFKVPKFYGQPLNCLKLWRAVIRLGGYDKVTGSKLWRQVGESFHPPKTCTTVSWTFRIFYEKSLLEYEKHKTQSGELIKPVAAFHEASGAETEGNAYQGSGPGRARRAAAAVHAMQGGHVQRLFGNGEDKNVNTVPRCQKNVKAMGSLKQKRPDEVEPPVKVARIETPNQLEATVVDVGPPADWVKVNIRQTKNCFEVYALVPGLLREEVRVQTDPAGRLVISGQPEQVDNPWGITPFKKLINLPSRIDTVKTSAVVSLHGRLFVRIPFEQ